MKRDMVDGPTSVDGDGGGKTSETADIDRMHPLGASGAKLMGAAGHAEQHGVSVASGSGHYLGGESTMPRIAW